MKSNTCFTFYTLVKHHFYIIGINSGQNRTILGAKFARNVRVETSELLLLRMPRSRESFDECTSDGNVGNIALFPSTDIGSSVCPETESCEFQ